ncbi:MAG: glycerophosphodiester phosphodiesterase [Candidatus Scatosoma sp.]
MGKATKKIGACIASAIAVSLCVARSGVYTFVKADTTSLDETIVQTHTVQNQIINAPAVICEAVDSETLSAAVSGEEKPADVILYFNEAKNVVDFHGKKIASFDEVYKQISGKIVPIVYVSTAAAAGAFIDYMNTERSILDIAVMSPDPSLVKTVREKCPYVRGIADFRTSDVKDVYDIVKITNGNYANVAVLSQSVSTRQNVEYVQSRFKTVWTQPDSTKTADLYDCINSGAYGVIAADYSAAYRAMENYPECYTRAIFNVAHRGLPRECNENSVSGVLSALENGATHVEVDGRLTSDGEIMLMHDATVDRTTNGSGVIEQMTYEQVRKYSLDSRGEEPVPTLGEIMDVLKDYDAVLVFEIKTANDKLCDALRAEIEKHGFQNRIVVISFIEEQLANMKERLPEIPTANLNTSSAEDFAYCLKRMGEYNTGVDTPPSDRVFNETYLRDRGIIGWYWTYSSVKDMLAARQAGFVGLTNDLASAWATEVKTLKGEDFYGVKKNTFSCGDAITLGVETYAGKKKNVQGEIFYVEDMGEYYALIGTYTDIYSVDPKPMFTQVLKAYKANKSGCAGVISSVCNGLPIILICLGTVLCGRRKQAE